MERIAVYGKGGVGKSVVSTSLSACFAQRHRRVLHLGCDPKRDSAVRLLAPGVEPTTVLERLGRNPQALAVDEVIQRGRLGIDCCECGGPAPGMGCAGRGVARTLEFLEDRDLFAASRYDVVVFDVLGDVVCGGFAAPLRAGFAEKVLIVTSEEPMSIYAANNIARAVEAYTPNGLVLGGLVANLRSPTAEVGALQVFAALLDTTVLAVIPRDELIIEAERRMVTVIEHAPAARAAVAFRELAEALEALDVAKTPVPRPLTDSELFRFVGGER